MIARVIVFEFLQAPGVQSLSRPTEFACQESINVTFHILVGINELMSMKYFVSSVDGARDPDNFTVGLVLLDDVSCFIVPCFSFPDKHIAKATFIRSYRMPNCEELILRQKATNNREKCSKFSTVTKLSDLWPERNLTTDVKLIAFHSLLINFNLYLVWSFRIVVNYTDDTK